MERTAAAPTRLRPPLPNWSELLMHTHRQLLLMLYPYIFGGVIVEIVWYPLVRRRAYPWKEMLASTGIFLLRLPARLLLAPLMAPVSYFAWSHRLFTIHLNTVWGVALLFLGTEFAYYWVFNTPSHHRVHHASNAEYLDRNYGGILIIWDRLFGTFARERPQIAITYGLAHPIGSMNPIRIALHEWRAMAADVRRARTWRERFRQLFGRPGESLLLVEETRP